MAAAGKHDDRQLLRARPGKHIGKRDHVVLFAVDDDRIGRDCACAESRDRRCDQHHALSGHLLRDACLDECPEREPGEYYGKVAIRGAGVGQRGQRVASPAPSSNTRRFPPRRES